MRQVVTLAVDRPVGGLNATEYMKQCQQNASLSFGVCAILYIKHAGNIGLQKLVIIISLYDR